MSLTKTLVTKVEGKTFKESKQKWAPYRYHSAFRDAMHAAIFLILSGFGLKWAKGIQEFKEQETIEIRLENIDQELLFARVFAAACIMIGFANIANMLRYLFLFNTTTHFVYTVGLPITIILLVGISLFIASIVILIPLLLSSGTYTCYFAG